MNRIGEISRKEDAGKTEERKKKELERKRLLSEGT